MHCGIFINMPYSLWFVLPKEKLFTQSQSYLYDSIKIKYFPYTYPCLPYLLMKKVYDDAFILHDESADEHKESEKYSDDKNQLQKDRPHSAAVKSVSLCSHKSYLQEL